MSLFNSSKKKKKTAVSPLVRGSAAAGAAAQARAKKSTPKKQKPKQTVQPAKAAMSKAPVAKKKTTATSASGRNDAAVRQSYGQRAGTRTSSGAYKPTQSAAYNYKKAETKRSTISTDIKNQTKVKTQKPSVVSGPVKESRDNRDARMRQSWSQRHPENQVQREQRNEKQRPKSYVPTKGMATPTTKNTGKKSEWAEFEEGYNKAGILSPNERTGIAQGPLKDRASINTSQVKDIDTMLSGGTVPGMYIPDDKKPSALEYNIRMTGQDALSKPYAEEIWKNASVSEKARILKAATETVGFNEQTRRWSDEFQREYGLISSDEQVKIMLGQDAPGLGELMYRDAYDKYKSAVKQQEYVDKWVKDHGYGTSDYMADATNLATGTADVGLMNLGYLPLKDITNIEREPGDYFLGGVKAPYEGVSSNKSAFQNLATISNNIVGSVRSIIELPFKGAYYGINKINPDTDRYVDDFIATHNNVDRINRDRDEMIMRMNSAVNAGLVGKKSQVAGNIEGFIIQQVPAIATMIAAGPEASALVGGTTFFGTTAGAYAQSALDSGASLEEAMNYGILGGLGEGATEMIFPMAKGIGGGLLKGGANTVNKRVLFGETVRELEKSGFANSMSGRILRSTIYNGGEATEEMIMEIIDPYLQRASFNPEAENASLAEIGMAGLYGAAVSAVLHIPMGMMNTAQGLTERHGLVSNARLYYAAKMREELIAIRGSLEAGMITEEEAEQRTKEVRDKFAEKFAEAKTSIKQPWKATGSLLNEQTQGGEYKTSSNLEHLYSNRQEANAATVKPGTSAYFIEDGEVKRITHSEAGVKSEDAVLTNSEKTAYAEKAERLRTAKNNTERTGVQANVRQDIIDQASEMARVYNRNVEFYRDEEAAKRYDDRGRFDPKTETIYVNAATDKPLQTIISHEMVHAMRNTNAFKELLREIKTYYKDSYDADVADIRRMYSERDESGNVIEPSEGIIQEEVVAHFVEKKLLTDEAWVNTFLTNSRTDKILRGINTLLQRGLGGKEARFLASMRSKWLNALEEERGEQTEPRAEAVAAAKGGSGVRYAKGEKRDPNPYIYKMHRAKRMEELGYSEKDIIEATGWYKRKNKKDKKPAYIWAVRDRLSPGEKYDFRKSFAQQIDDYLKGKFHATDTFLVGDTPELLQEIGLDDLPVTLGIYHVLTAINYHDGHSFTIDEIKKLPEAIEKPLAVIRSTSPKHKKDSIILIVKLGEKARDVVAIRIGGNGVMNGKSTISNAIATFYSTEDIMQELNKAVKEYTEGKNSIYFFDTERLKNEANYSLERAGIITSGPLKRGGFINNIIGDYWENVKRAEENRSAKGSRDSEYLAAVERGDMETAQRLVDEAAEEALRSSKLRDKNGKLRRVFHGTNTGDFTVFNPDYIGMSSGDDGFFGRGFYFAYTKGEAGYYGARRIIPAYLDLKNPFNFETEIRTYNGMKGETGYAPSAISMINFAEKFPEIAKNVAIYENDKRISAIEFAEQLRDVLDNQKFTYETVHDSYSGRDEVLALGNKEMKSYEYDGKTYEYPDYDYQRRWYEKPNPVDVAVDYLMQTRNISKIPSLTSAILDWNREFTQALKNMNYDGVIQSEDGDEAVVFEPNQIKSADPVTYDDNGNVIPPSERFNTENDDLRYAKGDRHRFDPDVVATNYFVGDTVEVNGRRGKVEERYYDDGDIRYVVLFDDGSRKDVLPDELTTNVTPSFHFDELPEEEQEAFEEPPNDYDFYDDDIFYEDDDGDVLYEEGRGIRMGDIVTSEDSPKTVKKRKKASEKRKKFEKPKKKDSKSILDDELIKEFLATESDGFFDTGENYDLATYLTGDGVTYSKDYARNFDAASRGNQSLRGWLQDLFVRPLEKGKRDYANAVDRKLNQMRTKMKELGIKKGSQESAAVQWYGEKFYTDEYGVQHDYTLEDLKKEFPEKWEDIKEAAEWFRKVYDDYLVQINTARAKIYPDPVGDVTEKVNDYQDKVNYYEQRIDETRAEIREIERALDAKRQDYASKKDGTKVKEKLERSIRYNERRIEKRNAQIEEDILRKQKYKNLLERYQRDLNSGDVTRNKRIVPRKDYFHHFLELQQGLGNIFSLSRSGADIDPHLEGTSEFTQPKSKFAKITLHRKNGRYTPDAIGGMIDYIQAGEYMINIDPVISLFRSHIKGIMDATVEERNANKLIKWLVNWTNDLAGKTNTIDRFVMDRIGRDRIAFIKRLNSRAKANAVVGNLNSAFAQFFNFPNVAGYVHNPIAYAQGFEDLIKFIARQKDARMLVRESGFLNERYLDDAIRQFDERIIDKPEKLAVWTLTVGDRYTTVLIWFTAYHDALKKNVDDPIEYADDITRRSVAGRGIGEIPLTQKSLMTQLFAPFQIEVNNAWQLYKEKVKGIAKNETKKEKAEAAYGFASVLVMNFLLNTVTDLLIHRRVVFDPLFVFFEWLGSLGDDDDDEDETKFDKFTQLLGREIGEVFSSMPFGSLIAYYAIENDYLREQLFGDNDPTRYGVGNAALKPLASLLVDVVQGKDISDDVLTVLMTYLPPVGGKQIERFLTGLKMEGYLPDIKFSLKEGFSAEKHPAASYNAKGELQFPIEDFKSNPLQALVGLVFGKYATDAGQKYLGKDYDQAWWRNILGWNNIKPGSAMNERATSVFNALVAEGSDRFAIFDVLNELKGDKKISVKRDILLNSGLTDGEMAAILLNVITDKDKVESETNKLNSIIGTGAFNVSDYLKIKNIQSKINADKNMSAEDKALLFVEMLQGEGYSDSDVGIITEVLKFWKNIPANTKRYDTLTTYGLDSDTAAKVTKAINQLTPLEGASEVSEMQKFEAIAGLGLDDETETTALRTAFSDEKSYAKYVLAHNNGVSPQLYADFKKALKDANDNNPDESKRNTSYDKEEKQTALDSLSGATTAQKAALWQIADNALSKTDHDAAWKGARNPYDTSVGTTVADGYTSTLESVQSMKADTAELSTERAERDKYNHLKPIAAKAAALGKKIVKNLSKDKTTAETEEAEEESALGQPITEFTRVSSPFGYNVDSVHANRLHAGMDLAAPLGTPAMAVNGGKVIQASDKGNGYGNCVIYEDADGVQWLYGHLDTINVSVGDTITKGQKVGSIDSTGSSTGNHLHFEARVNGNPVNPQSLIDITGGGLVTADTGVKYSGGGGGGGRKSGGKKSGGSSGGKKGKATTQAAYTPTYAPTTTRSSASSGSSSRGTSSSKATRTPTAKRTQTSVAKGIMLPTAREIDSAKRRSTSQPTMARNSGKSASRGIVLPTAAEVASAAAGARIGYGSGTSSIRRTNRSRGSFWHENVLG